MPTAATPSMARGAGANPVGTEAPATEVDVGDGVDDDPEALLLGVAVGIKVLALPLALEDAVAVPLPGRILKVPESTLVWVSSMKTMRM